MIWSKFLVMPSKSFPLNCQRWPLTVEEEEVEEEVTVDEVEEEDEVEDEVDPDGNRFLCFSFPFSVYSSSTVSTPTSVSICQGAKGKIGRRFSLFVISLLFRNY